MHDLETRQYRMSMLCALRRVSVYSRSYVVQWELLQLGLATLGTALTLYYLMVCLSLLVVQEILLSTLVLVMVCTCLSVILTPWKDCLSQRSNVTCTLTSLTVGSYQETTRNKACTGEWDHLQLGLATLGRVYLLEYLSLLLLQAGDVERNPGPTPVPTADLPKLARLPVAPEWWSLGVQLGLPPDRLRNIQYNNVQYPDCSSRCLTDMFDWWLNSDCESTYENLATALGAIGRRDLTLEVCRENNLPSLDLSMISATIPSACSSDFPVSRYAEYLKSKYACKTLPVDEKRHYASKKGTKYINLAVVRKDNIDKSEMDKFTEATIHGNIDDITKEKRSLELSEVGRLENGSLARCVLVQGAPGVGKTTMAWELCRQWGEGKLLREYSLLVLLKLRDSYVQKATAVTDLFFNSDRYLQSKTAREVSQNHGNGTAFLLEGYDELPQEMQENSIFVQVINGEILPKAGVIITSRPSASDILFMHCCRQRYQHVEVLGFTEKQINSYVKERFGTDEQYQRQFESYLACYPHIRALMYIPLNCSIVIDVYRSSKARDSIVPRTQTELYSVLTRILLSRYMSAHEVHRKKRRWNLQSLADIPSDVEQKLMKLSELAYSGTVEQQLIFYIDSYDVETMGLMDMEYDELGSASYNFLHLTLQEFLAAYYVSKLPPSQQARIIDESIGKKHFVIVLRFFAGLTKFNSQHSSDSSFSSRLFKFLKELVTRTPAKCLRTYYTQSSSKLESLRWMFEAQDKQLLRQVLSTGTQDLDLSYQALAPFDCYVIGHCISQSECQWKLDLSDCNVGEEGMRMLAGGSGSSLHNVREINLISSDVKNGVIHLVSALRGNTVLTVLKLNGCHIDAEGISHLAQALCDITTLRELWLGWNTVDSQGARHLASALRENTVLTVLKLNGCHIDSEGTSHLAQALCDITTLEILNLDGNTVDSQGAKHLVSALRGNTVITVLGLWGCHIDAEGTSHLAQALCDITTLEILTLDRNTVDSQGVRHLALLLRRTHSLTHLCLVNSNIDEDGACQLAEALSANSTLRKLQLWNNPLGERGTKALVESLAHNTSVEYLHLPSKHKDMIRNSVEYGKVSNRIIWE